MRVGYVGGFRETWTTETHVARAFERHPEVDSVARLSSFVTSWPELVKRANEFDLLVFAARPLPHDRAYGPSSLIRLRDAGVPTVSYHLDIYNGLRRVTEVGYATWWKTDLVFTADGGTNDLFWERCGVRHEWLPAAIPVEECYRSEDYDDRALGKILFVGGFPYLPEWQWRRDLIGWLREFYRDDFVLLPTDGERIHGDDLNRLYASAEVVIGDSFCPHFAHGYYWSDRIYQTLGRGGLFVHPTIPGLSTQYEPGVDFEDYAFGDFIRLRQIITELREERSPSEIEAMRNAALEHTLDAHTYDHRVASMLQVLDERKLLR